MDDVGHVLNTLGHDLRGPLFTARGYIGLLAANLEDPKQKHLADTAAECLDDATRMMDGVLGWARTEPDRVVMEDLDLGALAAGVLHGVEGAERVKLETLPNVTGDKAGLRYAIQHLVENALAYAKGPVVVRGADWFEVVDQGDGFEDKAFRAPFWDAPDRSRGMGVAIVHKVALAHGCTLVYEKRDGFVAGFRGPG